MCIWWGKVANISKKREWRKWERKSKRGKGLWNWRENWKILLFWGKCWKITVIFKSYLYYSTYINSERESNISDSICSFWSRWCSSFNLHFYGRHSSLSFTFFQFFSQLWQSIRHQLIWFIGNCIDWEGVNIYSPNLTYGYKLFNEAKVFNS